MGMLTYYALSGLINGLTSTAVGLFVYTRNPKDNRNKTFGLFCLSLSVWSHFYFLWRITLDARWALFYARGLMAGAIFIPVFCLHHVLALLNLVEEKKKVLLAGYVASSIFFVSNFTPLFVKDVAPSRFIFKNWPNPGPLFHPYFVIFFAIVFYFMYLLFHAYRVSAGIKKSQAKYILVAYAVAYLGGSTNFPLWYDLAVYPVGNVFVSLSIAIVAYAIVRHRLMDISVVMEKGLIYTVLILLVGTPAYLILLLAQRFYFGAVSAGFSILLLTFMALAAFGFYVAKGKTEDAIARTFFRDRHDRYRTLSQFSKDLVSILDLKHLNDRIVETLARVVGSETVSLYLLDRERRKYLPIAEQGDHLHREGLQIKAGPGAENYGARFLEEDPLPVLLKEGKIIVREELEQKVLNPRIKITPEAEDHDLAGVVGGRHGNHGVPFKEEINQLAMIQAEVALPLILQGNLIGFCGLGRKQNNTMYAQEELDLLAILAQNAAIAVENARLHQYEIKTQKELQRLNRLRALETLAGGYAHEIRNPLVSIQTFFQLLPTRQTDGEFMTAFARQASLDAQRIERLCQEVMDIVRPGPLSLTIEDLNRLIQRTVLFLKMQPILQEIKIEMALAPDLPAMFLDSHKMKHALLNLLRNAVEAMPNGGVLRIMTGPSLKMKEQGPWVYLEVSDTGIGIPQEDLEHIFDPFFTTKHESEGQEATGLGLTVVHQIIDEHRGTFDVKSRIGLGTSFTIHLPVDPRKS